MESTYPIPIELNPQQVFQTMKSDYYKISSVEKPLINRDYLKKRKELINLNHKLTKKFGYKSQTFFLSIYYLDMIFLQNKNIQISNYFLLSLSCFIIAAKYSENDPNVPPLQNFVNIYNRYNIHQIGMKELIKMEVNVLKYLKYNIHFVTIYDFNLFFFNHGIIKKQQIKDIINNYSGNNNNINNNKSDLSANEELDFVFDDNFYIKKILEKIYKRSRYYLDLIICNENICFKYDALVLSIFIMKKSLDEVILKEYKIKYKDYFMKKKQIIKKNNTYFKEIMESFYKIDLDSNKYQGIFKDNDIIYLFQSEKEKHKIELKNKKGNNLYHFIKTSNNNINTAINNNLTNLTNLNDSIEKNKEENILDNKTKETNEEINTNSYMENIKKKYTFTQLKNSLKKDLSLKKKKCSDRYFQINNLKSLCKLTSCANTIQNIKEGSLSKPKAETNNQYSSNKFLTLDNTNIKNNLFNINNIIHNENNSNINLYNASNNINSVFQNKNKSSLGKKKELNLENIDNNKIKYNKAIITDNFQSKEKIKFRKTITESNNLDSNKKNYYKKVVQNYETMNKKIVNKNNIKINIYNILNTSNNINEISQIEKKSNFLTLNNNNNYIPHNQNKIVLLKKRMDEINKINKLKNLYNVKKLDGNIKYNIKKYNSVDDNRKRGIDISPKSKEINYINIINDTNDSNNNNIIDKNVTLENPSSYFKKKILSTFNKNQRQIKNNNKYLIKPYNFNSERENYNKRILLTSQKIRDNDSNIINNDINNFSFKQKFNMQFHSKLFSSLTNNNK